MFWQALQFPEPPGGPLDPTEEAFRHQADVTRLALLNDRDRAARIGVAPSAWAMEAAATAIDVLATEYDRQAIEGYIEMVIATRAREEAENGR
jgi:hypothetical protein